MEGSLVDWLYARAGADCVSALLFSPAWADAPDIEFTPAAGRGPIRHDHARRRRGSCPSMRSLMPTGTSQICPCWMSPTTRSRTARGSPLRDRRRKTEAGPGWRGIVYDIYARARAMRRTIGRHLPKISRNPSGIVMSARRPRCAPPTGWLETPELRKRAANGADGRETRQNRSSGGVEPIRAIPEAYRTFNPDRRVCRRRRRSTLRGDD